MRINIVQNVENPKSLSKLASLNAILYFLGQKILGKFRLTRIALNTQAEMPSATSYSPRSLGRIKLFSIEEVNILQNRKIVYSILVCIKNMQ